MNEKEGIIEVLVSFDTTGSMYPCITMLRKEIEKFTNTLFTDIPKFRMGLIAHGDYCDDGDTYVIKTHELSTNRNTLVDFVRHCGNTYGGDAPECYELVLHSARAFNWTAGKHKVLVLIGDDVPHRPNEPQNYKHLDWRNELDCLLEMGVHVYAVQALGRHHATSFYKEIAQKTKGLHLELNQFSDVPDLIKAICYSQAGTMAITNFVNKRIKKRNFSRSMVKNLTALTGAEIKLPDEYKDRYATTKLSAVPPGRFQVMEVDKDCPIKIFVQENGMTFKKGRGFYEFIKRVIIQEYKEIILQDKITGDFYSGSEARKIVGIPEGRVTLSPRQADLDKYNIFIQSTSYNRKLLAGTKFLYELDDWAHGMK
jgi:hypothetical protein